MACPDFEKVGHCRGHLCLWAVIGVIVLYFLFFGGLPATSIFLYWLMFYGTNGGWQVVWGLQLLRWVVEWFCLVVFLMCVVKALVNPSPSCCIVYIEGVGAV